MSILDFLTALPAEEKEIFLDLLEETGSADIAMKKMMPILAESEPKLARKLEGPLNGHVKNGKGSSVADHWAKRVQTFLGLDTFAS